MLKTLAASPRSLPTTRGRALVVLLASLTVLLGFAIAPTASYADDSSTLTIVGTSDVSDSGLSTFLLPKFQSYYNALHPATPLTNVGYVGVGTTKAIQDAEAGDGSALLVHAESLENNFVANGYSEEPYGRAIFYGDFVLLGPASDPAGIMSKDPHNVVSAFEDIATAGAAGTAQFVSRNDGSGTNVEEHEIWADTTTTPDLCAVAPTSGGGDIPNATSDCTTLSPPSWYIENDDTSQADNIEKTDACNFGKSDDCYTITDLGTFENLENQHELSTLKVVTSDESASAPGGPNLLVNTFHAYAINPNKFSGDPGVQLNLPAAEAFLTWITSPAAQADVDSYLNPGKGKGNPPFIPDASPSLTGSTLPATLPAGKTLTIKGRLKNVVPGTPALGGRKVTLSALRVPAAKGALPVAVATTNTNYKGNYVFKYHPVASAKYSVSTGAITQLENNGISPAFYDELAPSSTSLGTTKVLGAVTISSISSHNGRVTLKGVVAPTPMGSKAQLKVLANRASLAKAHGLKLVAERGLKAHHRSFTIHFPLARGVTWRLMLKFVNPSQSVTGASTTKSVTVH